MSEPWAGAFAGKVVLVTGGSRGIGRGIAEAFARAGAQVAIAARDREKCEAAAAGIGFGCVGYGANAGDPEGAASVTSDIVDRFGRIDVLVNNAATNPYSGLVIDVDLPRWQKMLAVNLTGPLVWSQNAWSRSMRDSSGGCAIVNISSVGGLWTSRDHGAYDISKAALNHLTMQLAAELGPKVRVNAIAPGLVKTSFNRLLFVDDPEGAEIAKDYPARRIGRPEDIAAAALFLASDQAGWITGQVLAIDGGGQIGFARTG